MGFGTSLMKLLMFIFNGIVWILGIVLLVIGILVLVEGNNWNDIIDGKTVPISIMLIIVGLAISIVGFLGCCGAMKQNGKMLIAYTIILAVIIMLQLVAGILAFIFSDQAKKLVQENLEEFLAAYTGDPDIKGDHAMNVFMEEFDCCGVNNADDFATKTDASKWVQANVPDSCCVEMTDNCGMNYKGKDDTSIHYEGCYTKGLNAIQANLKTFYLCAIIFAIVEFLQIVCACALKAHVFDKGTLA